MNKYLSKYLFYYPSTLIKGERIAPYLHRYRKLQWEGEEQIHAYQMQHARKIIGLAYRESPFYRALYEQHGITPEDIRTFEDIARLPTINKSDLIQNIEGMSTWRKRYSGSKTTGGSTGQPVRLYKNPDALARERAATWRAYEWAGISIGDAQGRFWGVPHSRSGRLKASITDLIANRLRVSAFNLTDDSLRHYYHQLRKFEPAYLYGYVSVVNELALYVTTHNLPRLDSLKCVITTSEILTPEARKTIETAFNVRVFNEYGCGEVGSIAHECENGQLHIMADNLLVEIDSEKDGSSSGEIIVTDFFNTATPMIRYRLGDFAALEHSTCSCDRSLPILSSVHGRAYDLIKLKNGRTVHPEALIYVFEGIQERTQAFRQFQAIQTSHDVIEISIVPTPSWNTSAEAQLLSSLESNLSPDIDYQVRIKEKIEREPSGKMRLVKSLVK